MISSSMLYCLLHDTTSQQQYPTFVPSFKILGTVVPEKSLTQIYIRVREGKMEREGKNKSQHLGFLSHNILGHSQGAYVI